MKGLRSLAAFTPRLLPIPLLLGIAPARHAVAADPPGAARVESSRPGTGTIRGKVVYEADRSRPWRLGRYYIKDAKTGELAEAVVALSRRGLKGPDAPRTPVTVTVDQKDFQFIPETVAIRAGDRVRFLNHDGQIHNVQTFHMRQSFNVVMPPSGEHEETFAFAGGIRQPYRITCTFHGAMRAWVFVFGHPWYQVTGRDGSFRLVDVPPGEYELELVHPAGGLQAVRTIAVKPEETVEVELHLSPDDLLDASK
jgi:plastocyanin